MKCISDGFATLRTKRDGGAKKILDIVAEDEGGREDPKGKHVPISGCSVVRTTVENTLFVTISWNRVGELESIWRVIVRG